MKKVKMYFEQVPLEVAKRAVDITPALISCAICSKPVLLEKCTIDEYGHAVHADCYFHKLAGSRFSPSRKRKSKAQ